MNRIRRAMVAVAIVAASSLAFAGCASGSADPAASSASADTAAAEAAIAPYLEQPAEFPVDQPLSGTLPAGTTFAYLQCHVPTCAVGADALREATATLGVELKVVETAADADSMQTAMNSIIEMQPDAVILGPVEPSVIASQLADLEADGVPVVSIGIIGAEEYGVDVAVAGTASNELNGSLMASWAVTEHAGDTNVVFYGTPELSFSAVVQSGFDAQVKELCPECTVREVDLPIATLGSTSPAAVVSDLQANPDTNVIVFAEATGASGLPAALQTAGIEVDSITMGPNAGGLADIEKGAITAGLSIDFQTAFWMLADASARLLLGDELPESETSGQPPVRILEQDDITFDTNAGWVSFDDFADRFAELWKAS